MTGQSAERRADLIAKLRSLSPMQRQMLIDQSINRGRTLRQAIPARPLDSEFRQSYPQRRLWFLDRIDRTSTMYNMPECARLRGPINYAAFQAAFDDVVSRHESLRAVFCDGPDGPVQRIMPPVSLPITHVDLSSIPPELREDEGRAMLFRLADTGFDLVKGPVVRMSLLKLEDDHHFLVINMHHIVSDGWSMGVFAEEFGHCLARREAGLPPDLPPLPIRYGDFVEWQLDRLTGPVLDAQLEYWRPRLEIVEDLELPFDRIPGPDTTDAGGFEHIVLDRALTEKIKACAKSCNVTLFMFLFSVFSILLHRYSGQSAITFGTPTAGRIRPETEPLIGFFANTLLITAQIRPTSTLREVAATVRESAIGAFGQDETPLEMLVDALRPVRNLARNPLFQLMFILQNSRKPRLDLAGSDVSLFAAGSMSVKFEMLMEFYEKDDGINGWLGYRVDLFDAATIRRLAQNFQTLLVAIVADPDAPINQHPLSSTEVTQGFNDNLNDDF